MRFLLHQPPVDERAANADLQRIAKSLAVTYGNDLQLLDKESEWMDNSRKVCDMLLAEYQQIAALPKKRAANVVRYLVAVTSKKDRPTVEPEIRKAKPVIE
jgi:hypothetical protein